MKKLCLVVLASVVLFATNVRAVLPTAGEILVPVRDAISNQLVAATNAVPQDKRLVGALKSALVQLGRANPTNVATDVKILAVVVKSLSRTAVSNALHGTFETAGSDFYDRVLGSALSASNRLALLHESGPRKGALKSLNQLLDYLNDSDIDPNLANAFKLLSSAAGKVPLVDKLIEKARVAPLPPAHYSATITGALYGDFNWTPKPANAIAAAFNTFGNFLIINGVNGQLSGGGLSSKLTTRTLVITIPNITDGTTVYNVGTTTGTASVLYTVGRGGPGGVDQADGYQGVSGTLTITANKANRTAVGTFSFTAPGENTATTASTSNGSFSVVWTQ
jgi:hypothetical protein